MVSRSHPWLLAALLICGAAMSCGRRRAPAPFTVLDNPEDEEQVEAAQYRITVDQGATIVTIYAGMKPTGGYAVKIGKVTRNGDTCRVSYGVRGPSPDSMVTQALTYPSASVRVEAKCPNVEVNPPVPRGPLNSPRDGQTK